MQKQRLYFLDALRAFAIIMMLQGHFVHTLLDTSQVNTDGFFYSFWEYLRGITAPTFFTITGFVFTYLIVKNKASGYQNPRVSKGVKRALKLIFWGYFLRLNVLLLFAGEVNQGFYLFDVLHTIGISLLLLIALYVLLFKISGRLFRYTLLFVGVLIFMLEPVYGGYSLSFLPKFIANIFTGHNGSVFTIFPWFGYVAFGGFLGSLLHRYQNEANFYRNFITTNFSAGLILLFLSSAFFMSLHYITGMTLFKGIAYNNYLFIRLGDVLIIMGLFVVLRYHIRQTLVLKVGTKTLSIYIVHFVILYGSWLSLGLNRWFYHSLSPIQAIIGALLFIAVVCTLVLGYYHLEPIVHLNRDRIFLSLRSFWRKKAIVKQRFQSGT